MEKSRDNILTKLKQAIRSLEKYSNGQNVGAGSFINKRSMTSDLYDFSLYLPPNDESTIEVVATTVSGNITSVRMLKFYTWDKPDVMANALDRTGMPGIMLTSTYQPPQSDGTLKWHLHSRNTADAHTLYIKVGFFGADDVTFTINKI